MRTASIRIAGAATLVCLAISACVPDETVRPFGGEVLGAQSGGGGGSSGGLVRGVAGSNIVLLGRIRPVHRRLVVESAGRYGSAMALATRYAGRSLGLMAAGLRAGT